MDERSMVVVYLKTFQNLQPTTESYFQLTVIKTLKVHRKDLRGKKKKVDTDLYLKL